jgi:hypothetical protein
VGDDIHEISEVMFSHLQKHSHNRALICRDNSISGNSEWSVGAHVQRVQLILSYLPIYIYIATSFCSLVPHAQLKDQMVQPSYTWRPLARYPQRRQRSLCIGRQSQNHDDGCVERDCSRSVRHGHALPTEAHSRGCVCKTMHHS